MTPARGVCALFLLAFLATAGRAMAGMPSRLPELSAIPMPDGVRVGRILDDAALDGHPFVLRELQTSLGCDVLLAQARRLWQVRLSPHLLIGQRGRWQVLSAAFADGFVNLQAQAMPEGPCEALLSRWPFVVRDAAREPLGVRAILPDWPAGVHVLRHLVERRDGVVTSVTTAQSALPVAHLLAVFARQIQAQGYRADVGPPPVRAQSPAHAVLASRKAGAELTVLLNTNGDATDVVLIHDQRFP